jgi:flagellin
MDCHVEGRSMGLTINNNIPALNAQHQAAASAQGLRKATEGLASGLRINQAADDAAGLGIAEGLRTQVRQYAQEVNNLQTGVNVIQTADQAMGTQQEAVGRLQELATQAANGTLNDQQRNAINQEAQQVIQQIGQTAQNTEFNGVQLLNGTAGPIPVGTEAGNQININPATPEALGITGANLGTQEGAAAAVETLNNAANQISQGRANLGAQNNRLAAAIESRQTTSLNLQNSESAIRDQDVARGVVDRTRNAMTLQRSMSALVQGNIIPQSAAQLLGT